MKMAGINHIRIDDRLIHGQVATMWSNRLGITRIMVASDTVANDPIQKQMLRMATPSGIASSIITVQTAINNIKANKYMNQNVLLIVKSPIELVAFIEEGLDIESINVGNMSHRTQTEIIKPNISVTEKEKEAFRKLLDKNIEITTIMTPDDRKSLLSDVLS